MKKHTLKISVFLLIGLLAFPMHSISIGNSEVRASANTVITTRSSQTYIDNYYASISSSATGNTLKTSLESLLNSERGRSFSYGTHQSQAFPYTDVDPARPNDGYIVSFYSGTPVKGYSGMNKEHTWPDSHGGNKIESDPHVIRPTLTSENSARGNMYYAQSPNPGWDPASFSNPKYRGISARIIFYGATIGASGGLILEDVGRGQASGTGNKMGKLGDLLKWNLEYPVDQTEIIRNETLDISLNYNRNPFIDDPSLACRIWGDTNSNTQSICAQASVAPESMSLSPSETTTTVGTSKTLSVNVTPSNAAKTVTWSSSNPSVATITNGVVNPLSVGVVTITATSTLNTAIQATATITVNEAPVPEVLQSISVKTLPTKTVYQQGDTFSASGLSIQLNYVTYNSTITSGYTLSTANMQTLGEQTITVTYGGKQTSFNITVIPKEVTPPGNGKATDLFFSEYLEGSGSNKALEIYNGTGNTVDLSSYSIKLYSNGAFTPGNTQALSGTLANGQTYVIHNSGANSEIKGKGQLASTVTYFNGNDAIELCKNDIAIDTIGVVGQNPTTAWTKGNKSMAEQTLVRNENIISPTNTFNFDEWTSYSVDTSTYLGSHVMNAPTVEEPSEEPSSEIPSEDVSSEELPSEIPSEDVSSEIPSSEVSVPVSSEEVPSSSDVPPVSSSEGEPAKGGCNGSIVTTSSMLTILVIIGIGFNLFRRKRVI